MSRTFLLIVAALFAAFAFPAHANSNRGTRSEIVAGQNNTIDRGAANSTIAGGNRNRINRNGKQAIVAGGQNNQAGGNGAFAAGNRAQAVHAGTFVWGDSQAANFASTGANQFLIRAAGGVGINTANPSGNALSVVGNTLINGNLQVTGTINALLEAGAIGAGRSNSASGAYSAIAGGEFNKVTEDGTNAFIGGGLSNIATTNWTVIGGGRFNRANAFTATIAGGENNHATNPYSFIGGGANNISGNAYSGVAAGAANHATGYYSYIGGGWQNLAASNWATLAGGLLNKALGDSATIGGGQHNTASAPAGFIGGGVSNIITEEGTNAVLAGGAGNTASGFYATVPGGVLANASHDGSFVWSGDPNEETSSFDAGTFTVRAEGGVRFYTANGTNVGAFLGPNGSWQVASDSNLKTKFTAVDSRTILSQVAAMPLAEWEYKAVPNRRHIGPMSQDFYATFGLGSDDKTISTLDSDGVMYAAIQGLVEELKDRDKAIEELKARAVEVDYLRSELRSLREKVQNSLPPAP